MQQREPFSLQNNLPCIPAFNSSKKKKKFGFFSVIVLPTSRYDFPGMKKRPYGAEKTALGKDVGAVSAGTRDSGWGTSPLASVPSNIQLGVR